MRRWPSGGQVVNSDHPFAGKWEQRWHPLRREWVVYSAHRDQRPWHGGRETARVEAPAYDPACYLCPGNVRVSGKRNPDYRDIFLFDNDHPVVGPGAPSDPPPPLASRPVHQCRPADGLARVLCYDPRHHVSLSEIRIEGVVKVFEAWRDQMREFLGRPKIRSVLIFENKGEIVGTSCPHPHCQIYAANFVFKHVEAEMESQKLYEREHHANLFDDLLAAEREDGRRIVAEREQAIAFLPYFARYSYELWIFPKRRHATLATLTDQELFDLASVYQEANRRYDLLFGMSFPYVMSVYQAPVDGGEYSDYHSHFVFLPPLRGPDLKKFPAGPEIGGGNFMCDTMPEDKARELRQVDLNRFKGAE